MAKRVIQMYDKYKSTTKTYPKIIKECLQKDVTDYIEGQVEANPTLAGSEAELTGLQVGDTKYKVPQGTTVIANPDPAGETALTGLQIGDTKYKVGSKLYQHNLWVKGSRYAGGTYHYIYCGISITSYSNTPLTTYALIKDYLISKDCTSINKEFTSVNGISKTDAGTNSFIIGIWYDTTNDRLCCKRTDYNNTHDDYWTSTDIDSDIKDNVIEL